MKQAFGRLLLPLLLALVGCAPAGTPYSGASIPPVPAGSARVVLYRDFEVYQSLSFVPVFLNRADVGAVGPGKILIRDVPPGTYAIEAKSQGLWPNQVKTVTLAAGDTAYAKIESFRGLNPSANRDELQTTFVVELIAPEVATRELQQLRLEGSVPPAAKTASSAGASQK